MRPTVCIILLVLLFSCSNEPQQQYFESSPEIDIVKKGNAAFFSQDWTTLRSVYADTALIAENTWERSKMITPDRYIEESKTMEEMFAAYSMGDDAIYCMVIDNKGERWVLNWFRFIIKTKGGKEVTIPTNMNLRFEGNKIVFQSSMYDQLPLMLAMQAEQRGDK